MHAQPISSKTAQAFPGASRLTGGTAPCAMADPPAPRGPAAAAAASAPAAAPPRSRGSAAAGWIGRPSWAVLGSPPWPATSVRSLRSCREPCANEIQRLSCQVSSRIEAGCIDSRVFAGLDPGAVDHAGDSRRVVIEQKLVRRNAMVPEIVTLRKVAIHVIRLSQVSPAG